MLLSVLQRRSLSSANNALAKLAKRDLILKQSKKRSSNTICSLFVPQSFEITCVSCGNSKKSYLFLYNDVIKLNIPLPASYLSIAFERASGSLLFKSYLSNAYHKQYIKQLSLLLTAFHSVFFKKLKFKGKGYYIYKNKRNTVAPQFGYSHRVYIYSWFTNIKFLGKTSLVIFGLTAADIRIPSRFIKNFRPINVFTGRGVRFSREVIYSKPGKVSSYR